MQNNQVDINKVLQILGSKEIEITLLRERIAQLEQEKAASKEKSE